MRLSLALCAALAAAPAFAHEVWIDPEAARVAPGTEIVAAIRNGQEFEGSSLAWLPPRVARAEVFVGGGTAQITSRPGDIPALKATPARAGLAVLLYRSEPADLTYDSFDSFVSFLEEKGNASLLQEHRARGLPEAGVTEVFARYAKALVAVGSGAGRDSFRGMEIELVAETNPFAGDERAMTFRLYYDGAPLAGHRVTYFDRAPGGRVTMRFGTTDGDGRIGFGSAPGHQYLVDAVVVREPQVATRSGGTAMWESLWASLTFEIPG